MFIRTSVVLLSAAIATGGVAVWLIGGVQDGTAVAQDAKKGPISRVVDKVKARRGNTAPGRDNMIDGERYPDGYTPMEIKNGVYPRMYAPNTEKLGPKEMRVIALGTGMPNVITGNQKASGWYVELGNGDKFLFDVGSGTMENLAKLRPDWSKVDKVFASHLHSDHVGDFADIYIGTKAFVDNQVKSRAWDVEGRRTGFPISGGKVIAHEFDFRNEGVIYEENGVKISSFPAIHILDGSVSFRLDWNGRSFVFGGDTSPNKWFVKYAKGAELVVHECFFTPEQLQRLLDTPLVAAIQISAYIHTPPGAFGKIMSAVEPRHAIGYHAWWFHDI